jgi:glycoprotein 6-alpha-L-fucosyltransferase
LFTSSITNFLLADATGEEPVIYFPFSFYAYNLRPRPTFLPSAVPKTLARRLQKLNGHPISWWLGWINELSMKMTPLVEKRLTAVRQKVDFQNPIAGVHIRRTDKLDQGEANFHPVEEYMAHVDGYYDQLELTEEKVQRRLYLASEDPKVLQELQEKYPNYQVLSNFEATKEANKSRWTLESLVGVMTDIELLAACDFVVCTYSSNVCRIVLEKLQTKHHDAPNRVRSVDHLYSNYGQNQELGRVVQESKDTRKLGVVRGDLVHVYYHVIYAGHFLAKNLETNETWWVSSFEIENLVEESDFPYL